MKNVIKQINDFLGMTTGLLINLIVAGTIIGILYDDIFGVIAGIGNAVSGIMGFVDTFLNGGLSGLLVLVVFLSLL